MKPILCLFLFVSLLLHISLVNVHSSQSSIPQNPIEIAAVFSESGIAAEHNRPLLDMTKLAVKTLNDNGGLLGRRVKNY